MERFLALRKWESDSIGLAFGEGASYKENYAKLRRNAEPDACKYIDQLERAGLIHIEAYPRDASIIPNSTLERDKPNFSRFPYVGAYVINTEGEEQTLEVKKVLANDYRIIPDMEFKGLTSVVGNCGSDFPNWPKQTGIDDARSRKITGKGVTVLVLDTGIFDKHEQFSHKKVKFLHFPTAEDVRVYEGNEAYDSSLDGHGTHVCGIVCAEEFGIAPEVDLVVASIFETQGDNTSKTFLRKIISTFEWMFKNKVENLEGKTSICNMSFGVPENGLGISSNLSKLRKSIQEVQGIYNVLFVGAIGNLINGIGTISYPAIYEEVLSTGAVDFDLENCDFSCSGEFEGRKEPNIFGIGKDVYSCDFRNSVGTCSMSGTSQATAYVTGIAALYAQQQQKLEENQQTLEVIRQTLLRNASPLKYPDNRLARFIN